MSTTRFQIAQRDGYIIFETTHNSWHQASELHAAKYISFEPQVYMKVDLDSTSTTRLSKLDRWLRTGFQKRCVRRLLKRRGLEQNNLGDVRISTFFIDTTMYKPGYQTLVHIIILLETAVGAAVTPP